MCNVAFFNSDSILPTKKENKNKPSKRKDINLTPVSDLQKLQKEINLTHISYLQTLQKMIMTKAGYQDLEQWDHFAKGHFKQLYIYDSVNG